MQQTKLKVLDLFSGIGGFSLGLESTGHFETIAFCEKDEFCQKVLQKNFKNIPIEGDVRNVKGDKYKADVVVGGFPCQSISIAGKQKGKDDDRFLFPEMLRVIKEVKPRWIIGENVQNLINISNGTILREIVEGLETEGFEVQCFSISASSQGAWHKRERVWIIASNTNNRLSIGENQEIQTRGDTFNNGSSSNVPNSQCNEHQHTPTRQSGTGELWGFYSEKEKQTSHDLWSKTSRCNAPFRQKSWWQTQSELCRIPHGLSTSMDRNRANRIKALGNSIVPQIARELGKAIIIAEND
jgi:DNA (cytosine-5)-methyltransferase 1